MGLHKRHTHGRVFRGEAAREQMRVHKRDSHGNTPVMHVPDALEEKETAQQVVYVTLSQTFSGPAIYSTLTGGDSQATPVSAAAQSSATNDAEASYLAQKSSAQAGNQQSAAATSGTSVATVTPQSSNAAAATTLATASATAATSVVNAIAGTPVRATHAATSTAAASQISQEGSGLSPGGKAGLAIGILLAIALAGGLIFFCYRRKRNTAAQEEALNEKHGSFADAGARAVEAGGRRDSSMTERVPASLRSSRTASTAPRLSLRPVTQFLPNLAENRKSGGNTLNAAAAEKKSAWERPANGTQQNPFDDATMLSEKQARPESPPSNPFEEPEGKKSIDPAAATANGAPRTSKSSWEGSEPQTPKSTKFGTAAAVPVAAAIPVGPGAGAQRGPNNVHRVQLDFKPSMDDELELRSGQLVRMLHEYDDGWALCIRMDRSQQGVAPRTCLSKMPVRPRNGPPGPPGPPGPGPRPGTAQGPRRPSNPPPPTMTNGAMYPRPLTPTQAQANRSTSPTSTSAESSTSQAGVPARKPVPGQAM